MKADERNSQIRKREIERTKQKRPSELLHTWRQSRRFRARASARAYVFIAAGALSAGRRGRGGEERATRRESPGKGKEGGRREDGIELRARACAGRIISAEHAARSRNRASFRR